MFSFTFYCFGKWQKSHHFCQPEKPGTGHPHLWIITPWNWLCSTCSSKSQRSATRNLPETWKREHITPSFILFLFWLTLFYLFLLEFILEIRSSLFKTRTPPSYTVDLLTITMSPTIIVLKGLTTMSPFRTMRSWNAPPLKESWSRLNKYGRTPPGFVNSLPEGIGTANTGGGCVPVCITHQQPPPPTLSCDRSQSHLVANLHPLPRLYPTEYILHSASHTGPIESSTLGKAGIFRFLFFFFNERALINLASPLLHDAKSSYILDVAMRREPFSEQRSTSRQVARRLMDEFFFIIIIFFFTPLWLKNGSGSTRFKSKDGF